MGAERFRTEAKGKTAQVAFQDAVEKAQYEHGHAGYTGTIAEKLSFEEFPLPKEKSLDGELEDKWGPAGCIEIKPGEFIFFGWASC